MPEARPPAAGALERAGAIAVAAEAALAAIAAVVAIVAGALGRYDDGGAVAFLAVFSLAVAAGLAFVARALARGARWGRGPAVVWQVLEAAVALGVGLDRWWLALLLLAPVPVAVAGVLSATARTERESRA